VSSSHPDLPPFPDSEFQFMGLAASLAGLHQIFSMPLVPLRLWSRYDKSNTSALNIISSLLALLLVEMGFLRKSWPGIL
jgi:hypothetical protein